MQDRTREPDFERSEQLDYWLRRAEQESIAAIRSTNLLVAERHDAIAQAYSAKARSLLDMRADQSAKASDDSAEMREHGIV